MQKVRCYLVKRLQLIVSTKFQVLFNPIRFFSPFPHGTCSLSVTNKYLGFEDDSPIFKQNYTCSALYKKRIFLLFTGLSPYFVKHLLFFQHKTNFLFKT
jgi:hypothetical protein